MIGSTTKSNNRQEPPNRRFADDPGSPGQQRVCAGELTFGHVRTLRDEGAKQTLLDTLPNLDDPRFEDGCKTMDVGSWLRSLGLGQYEANFRDNKIDVDLLPRLTVDDLKDIGVSVVGDRRRLLDAIAAWPAQVLLRAFPLPQRSLPHPRASRHRPNAAQSR